MRWIINLTIRAIEVLSLCIAGLLIMMNIVAFPFLYILTGKWDILFDLVNALFRCTDELKKYKR